MTLSRQAQVEDLANWLSARRREALVRGRSNEAYRRLVATVLEVPVDGVEQVITSGGAGQQLVSIGSRAERVRAA